MERAGGENIYPREVEDLLYAHPAILEASVVGIPDHVWGEVPIAFVQLKPGYQSSEQELMDFCREKLASYKVPRI
jgi:acyl-CoA synthetase (AMP-forming)/AMP-acid ligase II